ncbi:MAG: hypothetical protein E7649_03695 [Ruminococcaceae bacterium]|nr:hypothetical protein [Oscillospiraceae bacterium]
MIDASPKTTESCALENKISRRLLVYLILTSIFASVCAVLGAIVTARSAEQGTRYFISQDLTPALYVTVALTVVFAVSSFFVFKNIKTIRDPKLFGSKLRFVYLLPVAATVALAISKLLPSSNADTVKSLIKIPASETYTAFFKLILLILLVLCAIYSFLHILRSPNRLLMLISGMAQTVFCIFIVASLYMDLLVELNSPYKLVVQFGAIFLAIDTCMELRGLISGVSIRACVCSKTLSISFAAFCFGVILCAAICDAGMLDTTYLLYSIYFICHAACSLFALCFAREQMLPQVPDPGNAIDPDNLKKGTE